MQFRTASTAMRTSSLTVRDVHAHYLDSGGCFDELEIDAYLHGLIPLPRDERDCITQAVNELVDDALATGMPGGVARASCSDVPAGRRTGPCRASRRRLMG